MIRENLWLASSSPAPDYDRVIIFVTYFFLDSWNILDCWSSKKCPKHSGKTWGKQKKKPQIVTPIEEKCANNCLVLASKQLSTRIQMKINWQINSQELKEAKLHKRKMKGFEEQEVDIQYLKGYDILRKNDCGHQFELLCALHNSRVVTHTQWFSKGCACAQSEHNYIPHHVSFPYNCPLLEKRVHNWAYAAAATYYYSGVYNWHPEDAQGNH